jgi:inosine-uridine nucleoside N-ribohydrolase
MAILYTYVQSLEVHQIYRQGKKRLHMKLIYAALLLNILPLCVFQFYAQQSVRVILDTDIRGDCDDAGALAVLHALADLGEAEILAVVTNLKEPTNSTAAAVDVINTYYGRTDIPIGTYKREVATWDVQPSPFCSVLKDQFPNDAAFNDKMPDALDIYRKVIASQPDTSVTICSVGALSNLSELLHSGPDQYSSLDGRDLVISKVKKLVVMGGEYPRSSRPEYNIRLDPLAAVTVTLQWPGEIIWQGFEVGFAIITGAELQQTPLDNPVRKAYELRPFRDRWAIDQGKPSHDQAAVLIAVRGVDRDLWRLSPPGLVVVDSEGNTEWKPVAKGNHRFVTIKPHPARLEKIIGELMSAAPKRQLLLPATMDE